jgi:hypothetical protein
MPAHGKAQCSPANGSRCLTGLNAVHLLKKDRLRSAQPHKGAHDVATNTPASMRQWYCCRGMLHTAANIQQMPQPHRCLQHKVLTPGGLRDACC